MEKIKLADLVVGHKYLEHLLDEPEDGPLEVLILSNEYTSEEPVIAVYLIGAFLLNDRGRETLLGLGSAKAILEYLETIDVEELREGLYEMRGFCDEGLIIYDGPELQMDEHTVNQDYCGRIQYTEDERGLHSLHVEWRNTRTCHS